MDIKEKVKEIIADVLKVDVSVIEDDTAIGDSLHHIRIISEIEKAFGFRFTPDVMMDLEDVEDIVAATTERSGH